MNLLPFDIINTEFFPKLGNSDFFNLTAAYKSLRLNPSVQARIEQVKESIRLFISEYGAIARSEAGKSIKDLRGRIEIVLSDKYVKDEWKEYKNIISVISDEISCDVPSITHPLQDIKDKCKRLITLNRMHTVLSNNEDYTYSFPNNPRYHHDFDMVKHSCCPKELIDVPKFLQLKTITLGKPVLNLGREQVPYSVTATFPLEDDGNLADKTELSLRSYSHILGTIKFTKFDKDRLYASVSGAHLSSCASESNNQKNLKVLKIIIQIAVEIFMHESQSILYVGNVGIYPILDAGFSFYEDDDFKRLSKHKNRIKEAKEQGNLSRLFNATESFIICKTASKEFGTQFVNRCDEYNKEALAAALVDFELGQDPITWEEQIQKNPLIQMLGDGPILPNF